MKSGIYKIYNKKTHQYYIGQSINVDNRLNQHKKELRKGKHINSKLQTAFNKYGEEAFDFAMIKEVEEEFLNVMERYYMEKYETLTKGYNKTVMNKFVRDDIRRRTQNRAIFKKFELLEEIEIKVDKDILMGFEICKDFQVLFNKYLTENEKAPINRFDLSEEDDEYLSNLECDFRNSMFFKYEENIIKKILEELNEYSCVIEIAPDKYCPDLVIDEDINILFCFDYKSLITNEIKYRELKVILHDIDLKKE